MLAKHRSDLVALALVAAGCLPSETPAAPKPVVDADLAELAYVWKISAHVLGTKTTMTEQDAADMHGRTVVIAGVAGDPSYTSPWHGSCESAKRTKQTSSLVEITADVDLSPDGRATAKQFGIAKDVTEYTLTCAALKSSAPPLTMYLTGNRAMTCFGGVCYFLTR